MNDRREAFLRSLNPDRNNEQRKISRPNPKVGRYVSRALLMLLATLSAVGCSQKKENTVDILEPAINIDAPTMQEVVKAEDPTQALLDRGLQSQGFKWREKEITAEQIQDLNKTFARYYELSSKETLTEAENSELNALGQHISDSKGLVKSIGLRVLADEICEALNFMPQEGSYVYTETDELLNWAEVRSATMDGNNAYTQLLFGTYQTGGLHRYLGAINGGNVKSWSAIIGLEEGSIRITKEGNLEISGSPKPTNESGKHIVAQDRTVMGGGRTVPVYALEDPEIGDDGR